jgi:hypothetical protein
VQATFRLSELPVTQFGCRQWCRGIGNIDARKSPAISVMISRREDSPLDDVGGFNEVCEVCEVWLDH